MLFPINQYLDVLRIPKELHSDPMMFGIHYLLKMFILGCGKFQMPIINSLKYMFLWLHYHLISNEELLAPIQNSLLVYLVAHPEIKILTLSTSPRNTIVTPLMIELQYT